MRTNIDIDDNLMAAAQEATGLPTKRAVVEEGLRTLVRLQEQQGIRALRGRIRFVEEPPEDGQQEAGRDVATLAEDLAAGGVRGVIREITTERSVEGLFEGRGREAREVAVVPNPPRKGAKAMKRTATTGQFLDTKGRTRRAKGGAEGTAGDADDRPRRR